MSSGSSLYNVSTSTLPPSSKQSVSLVEGNKPAVIQPNKSLRIQKISKAMKAYLDNAKSHGISLLTMLLMSPIETFSVKYHLIIFTYYEILIV